MGKRKEEELARKKKEDDERKRQRDLEERQRRIDEQHRQKMEEHREIRNIYPYLNLKVGAPIDSEKWASWIQECFAVHITEMKKWKKKQPGLASILKRESEGKP